MNKTKKYVPESIKEVRAIKDAIAKKYDYDLRKLFIASKQKYNKYQKSHPENPHIFVAN